MSSGINHCESRWTHYWLQCRSDPPFGLDANLERTKDQQDVEKCRIQELLATNTLSRWRYAILKLERQYTEFDSNSALQESWLFPSSVRDQILTGTSHLPGIWNLETPGFRKFHLGWKFQVRDPVGSLCCVFWTTRSRNGFQHIVREDWWNAGGVTLWWTSIPSRESSTGNIIPLVMLWKLG